MTIDEMWNQLAESERCEMLTDRLMSRYVAHADRVYSQMPAREIVSGRNLIFLFPHETYESHLMGVLLEYERAYQRLLGLIPTAKELDATTNRLPTPPLLIDDGMEPDNIPF